jgi:hypothetical protein
MVGAVMPEIGDWRYFVEYLDYEKGRAAMIADGGDPDNDTLWDYCSQGEITVRVEFPTKSKAVAYAQKIKRRDVFHMPRIEEQTYVERSGDEDHHLSRSWEQTGYWEMDGQTEIEFEVAF